MGPVRVTLALALTVRKGNKMIQAKLKLGNMRRKQGFVVYPRGGDESKAFKIQSDTYIALVHPESGKAILAGPHAGGAYSIHLTPGVPKQKAIQLDPEQLQAVIDAEAQRGQRIGANVYVG